MPIERQAAAPVPLPRPAGHRQDRRRPPTATHRDASAHRVPEIAARVRVHHVLVRVVEKTHGGEKLRPAAGAVQRRNTLERTRRIVRGPPHRDHPTLSARQRWQHRAVARPAHGEHVDRVLTLHAQRLLGDDERLAAARREIARRVRRIHAFDEEVDVVQHRVRVTPGDRTIVARDHEGHPRQRHARNVEAAAVERHQIPQARGPQREVHVVGQDGLAGPRPGPADHPGVRGARHARRFQQRRRDRRHRRHLRFEDGRTPVRIRLPVE